ncbi:extracellular catalytic domain type 1 short-chain-length polyhydroxyalkanoate depolymerase [Actinokineospora sp.]|uniref:extracellular catalytic domain type 1 short-chain-length polyhydroxyalkanoate depolymerase n=1 Tax=Actinokineospora sp. TaxID=1872133 RepID=UPI004037DEF5
MRTIAAALAALLLAGCTTSITADGIPVGTSTRELGADRSFRIHRPAGLADPAPLVVVLHGGFGDPDQVARSTGWDERADAAGFLAVYPEGRDRAWSVGGGCCGSPGRDGTDDVAFVTAVVDQVAAAVPVDRARIYATGISNGGMLAYRLACDTDVFAAIGPVAATRLGECRDPAPVSVLAVHGSADRNVRFDGGVGEGVARIDGPPVPEVVAGWRAVGRCAEPVVDTAGAITTSSAACADGRSVDLVVIEGASHQWPGGQDNPVARRVLGLDAPSTEFAATDALWRFFAAHPRPG